LRQRKLFIATPGFSWFPALTERKAAWGGPRYAMACAGQIAGGLLIDVGAGE